MIVAKADELEAKLRRLIEIYPDHKALEKEVGRLRAYFRDDAGDEDYVYGEPETGQVKVTHGVQSRLSTDLVEQKLGADALKDCYEDRPVVTVTVILPIRRKTG